MIRDLKLLFKYNVFMRVQSNKKTASKTGWLKTLIIIAAISAPLGFTFYNLINNMMGIMVDGVSFAKIYIEFMASTFGIFFVVSFGSMMSYQFIKNEETEFLSPLPISKQAIIIHQFLSSLLVQSFMLIMIFIPVLIYAFKLGIVSGLMGIISAIITILFFALLGGIAGMLFSLLLKRSILKKMMFLIQVSSGLLWVFMFQFMPGKSGNMNDMSKSIANMKNVFDSPFNFFSWSVKGIDEPIYLAFGLGACLLALLLFLFVAGKINFQQSVSTTKGKSKSFNGSSVSFTLIKKELIIYKRNEQLLYFAFYPLVFGLIMGIINKSPTSMIMFMSIMGIPFIAQQSAFLLSQDAPFMMLMKSLPVNSSKILELKSNLPLIIGMLNAFIGIIIIVIINKLSPIYFIALIPVFFLNKVAVNEGIIFVIKTPPQGLNNPAAFMKAPGFIKITFSLIGLAMATCIPLLLMVDKSGNINFTQWWWPLIIVASIIFCIFRIRSTSGKIRKRVESWV